METSTRCKHEHTYRVEGSMPFRVDPSYRNGKPVMVDKITLTVRDEDPISGDTTVDGVGEYIKTNGQPGLTRCASYSGPHIKIKNLPAEVRDALTEVIRKGAH